MSSYVYTQWKYYYLWHWVIQVLHHDGDVSLCIHKLVNKVALAFHWPKRDGSGCVTHAEQHHFLPAGEVI